VTDYIYSKVAVYAELAGALRLARNMRAFVTDPVTAAPINVTQGAFTAPYFDSDSTGIADFTAATPGPIRLTVGAVFTDVYSEELPSLGLAAVASSAASAASAAASAALVGAPADSAVAAIMGNSASASRVVTDSVFGQLPDPAETVLFASSRGSDANDGLTLHSAKATIAGAISTLAGQPGRVVLAAQDFTVTAPVLFYSGLTLEGLGGTQTLTGQTKIVASGFTGSVIAPATPTVNTVNFSMTNIAIACGTTADVGLDLTRTSYSHIQGVFINGSKAGAVGYLFDAGVTSQCYFNRLDQCKAYMTNGTDLQFQNGANCNQINGGNYAGAQTGVKLLTISSWNVFTGVEFDNNVTQHAYVDAPDNAFLACHMEVSPIGYTLTANSAGTTRIGTTYDSACVTRVVEASGVRNQIAHELSGSGNQARWRNGLWSMVGNWFSSTTEWHFDALPFSGTASSVFRFFFNTTTSGVKQIVVHPGDGTSTTQVEIDAATGTIATKGMSFIMPSGGRRTIGFAAAAPTTGAQVQGSVVFNSLPAAGQPMGWQCTVSGNPGGTWRSMGNLP